MEFRTTPDKLDDGYYTILQFGIQAPANADPSTFSVNVSFDNAPGDSNYSKGLYTITVVNKSGENLKLDVFLSDDDREAFNPFLYAYRIKYINGNSEGFISNNAGADYFQAMAIFDIPAMGTASESSYD